MNSPHPFLLRRLAAMLYDTLLVLPLIMAAVAVAFGLRGLVAPGDEPLNPYIVQALAVFTSFVFFASFWLKGGQTLGMQAWRIKLVQFDGAKPTLRQTAIRVLVAVISAAALGLGYWWCLFDRNKRYWHDYASGTELILLPKKGASAPDSTA
jgi:uncharacterized RDD family membrane protein YckC